MLSTCQVLWRCRIQQCVGSTMASLASRADRSALKNIPRRVYSLGFRSKPLAVAVQAKQNGAGSGPESALELQLTDYKIRIEKKDFTLEQWVNKYKDETLNLTPEYQRGFVWEPEMASKLVISVLRQIYVPPVLLHQHENGTYDVVDGKQRMTSLIIYIMGGDSKNFPQVPCSLQLDKEDELFDVTHGVRFQDLPIKLQSKLREYSLTTIIMPSDTDLEAVFQQYEAINTSSKPHSYHQLRRAAYRGDYLRMMEEVADPSTAQPYSSSISSKAPRLSTGAMLRELTQPSDKMTGAQEDQELVLRFFALLRSHATYKAPMRTFLTRELQAEDEQGKKTLRKLPPAELQALEKRFRSVIEAAYELELHNLEVVIDKKSGKTTKTPLKVEPSPYAFDGIMLGLAHALESGVKLSQLKQCYGDARSALAVVLTQWNTSTGSKLTTAATLKERTQQVADALLAAVGLPLGAAVAQASPSRKRNFPKSTKKDLFQVALGSISQSAGSDSDDLSDAPDFATLQSVGRPPELQRQAATHRLSSKGTTAATSAISTPNSSSSSAGLPYRAIPVSSKPPATPSLLPPPAAVAMTASMSTPTLTTTSHPLSSSSSSSSSSKERGVDNQLTANSALQGGPTAEQFSTAMEAREAAESTGPALNTVMSTSTAGSQCRNAATVLFSSASLLPRPALRQAVPAAQAGPPQRLQSMDTADASQQQQQQQEEEIDLGPSAALSALAQGRISLSAAAAVLRVPLHEQGKPRCLWCGRIIYKPEHADVDHIVPYSKGGRTERDNAALLHTRCNQQKKARPMAESPYLLELVALAQQQEQQAGSSVASEGLQSSVN